ncbi:phage late control D family protein [Sorangium sp. So ce341]|uniref:phage late control D family protein n=1 Tax=Sorangium sp. So ce341 TaxID=3133302 RepID=UPI003F612BCB
MAGQQEAFVTMWLDGQPYEEVTDRVLRLEIEESTSEASSLRLSLDMAPGDGEWDLLADGRFALLHHVAVELGVGPDGSSEPAERAVVFDGWVTAVAPRIGEARVPDSSLEIEALDAFALMHVEERARTFQDRTDADIVRSVFESYGMSADVEALGPVRSASRGPLVQRGTDAELVRWLARRAGCEAYVEHRGPQAKPQPALGKDTIAHFHTPRTQAPPQPPLRLAPREAPSVVRFDARWESQPPSVVVASHIDERTRRLRQVRVTAPRRPRLGPTSRGDILAARLPVVLPTRPDGGKPAEGLMRASEDTPFDPAEAEQLAAADFERADWLAHARATVEGLRYPTVLRSRRPVALEGAGKLLDGVWYVKRARHVWERDVATKRYTVEADLARDALSGVG